MDLSDALKITASLQPFVRDFMNDLERTALTGPEKRQKVLDLTGSVYEGARRLGVLDGVKELKGIDWSLLAPLLGVLIDQLVALWNQFGLWLNRPKVAAKPAGA